MLHLEINKELAKKLSKHATESGLTTNEFIEQAIEEHIADMEAVARVEKIIDRIESGEENLISLEQARKTLDA